MNVFKKKIETLIETNKIAYLVLFVLFFFQLMPFHYQSKILIFWVLVAVLTNFKDIKFNNKFTKIFFINTAWVFWLLLSVSYSSNPSFGLKSFEKLIPLIIVPFVFFFVIPAFSKKQKRFLLFAFATATLLFTGYIFWYLHFRFYHLYRSIYVKEGTLKLFHYIHYLFNNLEYLYGHGGEKKFPLFFHKSYYSLSVLFSIHILIEAFWSARKARTPLFVCIILFIYMLLKFNSLIHILLLTITLFIVVFFKVFNHNLKKTIGLLLGCFILLVGFVLTNKNIKNKLVTSINSRNLINNCSIPLVKEKPIFGFGLGGVRSKLTACYKEKLKSNNAYRYVFKERQNTHNYYVHIFLSGGFIAFILFLYMLYFNIKTAVDYNALLYLILLLIFFGTLLVENTLARSYGTFFFALINSLFLKNISKSENPL